DATVAFRRLLQPWSTPPCSSTSRPMTSPWAASPSRSGGQWCSRVGSRELWRGRLSRARPDPPVERARVAAPFPDEGPFWEAGEARGGWAGCGQSRAGRGRWGRGPSPPVPASPQAHVAASCGAPRGRAHVLRASPFSQPLGPALLRCGAAAPRASSQPAFRSPTAFYSDLSRDPA
ncbi:mCG121511, isoform CRA_c, partial [Mus musculus]